MRSEQSPASVRTFLESVRSQHGEGPYEFSVALMGAFGLARGDVRKVHLLVSSLGDAVEAGRIGHDVVRNKLWYTDRNGRRVIFGEAGDPLFDETARFARLMHDEILASQGWIGRIKKFRRDIHVQDIFKSSLRTLGRLVTEEMAHRENSLR